MDKARWLVVLMAALAGCSGVYAQGIRVSSVGLGGLSYSRGVGSYHYRSHSHHSLAHLYLRSSGVYFAGSLSGLTTGGVTVIYYSSGFDPVVFVPAHRELSDDQELDLLRQRMGRGEPLPPPRPKPPEERPRAEAPPRPAPEAPKPKKEPPPPPPPPWRDFPRLPGPPAPESDAKRAAQQQIQLGREAFAEREYGRAERRFQEATVLTPDESLPLFLLAEARFGQGKYQEAVAAIEAGLRLRPDWPESGFLPRELYVAQAADYAEHWKRLADALARYPDDPYLLFVYAYHLWFDGRRDEARLLFQRARRGLPEASARFLPPPLPSLFW
jgi:hypothetical protein